MRSTSGAQIERLDGYVLKVGTASVGDRIGREVSWLLRHQDVPCLPKVHASWDRGYVMERLDMIGWGERFDWSYHVERCLKQLGDLWSRPAEHDTTPNDFLHFITARCEIGYPEVTDRVISAGLPLAARWGEIPRVLTHGDPTFDNQCYRLRDRPFTRVFIDPNPNVRVPPFRAADLGNLLQSIHGYEHLKYGRPMPQVSPEYVRQVLDLDDWEWHATRFFCLTKYVRLLSYETHLRPVFRDVIDELLEDEWTL